MNARPFICSQCLCRLKGISLSRGIKRSRFYEGVAVLATEGAAAAAVTIRATGASRSFSSSSFSRASSSSSSTSSSSSSPSSSWPALQQCARGRSYATGKLFIVFFLYLLRRIFFSQLFNSIDQLLHRELL